MDKPKSVAIDHAQEEHTIGPALDGRVGVSFLGDEPATPGQIRSVALGWG